MDFAMFSYDKSAPKFLRFDYINYRGEKSKRTVIPFNMKWMSGDHYHPEPQWLLLAFDIDKKELRNFAANRITNLELLPYLVDGE